MLLTQTFPPPKKKTFYIDDCLTELITKQKREQGIVYVLISTYIIIIFIKPAASGLSD